MPQADDSRVHRRLTLNSISNVARFVFLMVLAFFLTPFIVRTLGDSVYGFWVLLMSFLGYASILEMGVQPAVVKLVGQHRAIGQNERLQELVSAALAFFLTVGVLVFILCATVVPEIVNRWVDGLQEAEIPRVLYLLIGVDATLMYLNYLCTGILYGCQRYHLRNQFDVAGWTLNLVLILLFLERGGLMALILAKIAMDLLILLLSMIAIPRVFPELQVRFGSLRRDSFRTLMDFGGRVFLSATTTRLSHHAQPMIISTALTAASAAFFAIPVRLVDYVRQISWTLTAAFMPMFSELDSRNDQDMLRRIYLDYSRYFFILLLPFPILLLAYGPDFIRLWIGPDYAEQGGSVLYFLAGAVLLESFQPLMWRFFIGVGHLNLLVVVSAIVSGITIVASILLVRIFGITGVAMSLFSGAVVSQSAYLVYAARYLRIPWPALIGEINLRALVAGLVAAAVAAGLVREWGTDSYLKMAVGSVIVLTVHFLGALWLAVSPDERIALSGKISRLVRGR